MSRTEPGVILGRSQDRVELLFGLCSMAAFMSVTSTPPPAPVVLTESYFLNGTDAERKAEAEGIVLSRGATARYESGFLCASRQGPGGLTTELLFVPPIPVPPGSGNDA